MEHGRIKVDIIEDYPGAQWCSVRIKLPGYGNGPLDGEFVLVSVKNLEDLESEFFRPEYAKAIKKGLESV
jgi:hypothetical protein